MQVAWEKAGDCLNAEATIIAIPTMPVSPTLSTVTVFLIEQHSGRMIFSQRVEAGTATPNNVHENEFGDKSFHNTRLVSDTINLAGDEITSEYRASHLSLYHCRLYEKINDPAEETEWIKDIDFFTNLGTEFIF